MPCDGRMKVKPVSMVKGGVPYVKLAVDNHEPVEVHFPLDPLLEIDKIKWTLNGHPIDVDQDETKSAVYWKRDAFGISLIIHYPSKLQFSKHVLKYFFHKLYGLFASFRATVYWELADGSF